MLSKQQIQQHLASIFNTNPEFRNACLIKKRKVNHKLSVKTTVFYCIYYAISTISINSRNTQLCNLHLNIGSPDEAGCYIPSFLEDCILPFIV